MSCMPCGILYAWIHIWWNWQMSLCVPTGLPVDTPLKFLLLHYNISCGVYSAPPPPPQEPRVSYSSKQLLQSSVLYVLYRTLLCSKLARLGRGDRIGPLNKLTKVWWVWSKCQLSKEILDFSPIVIFSKKNQKLDILGRYTGNSQNIHGFLWGLSTD